MLKQMVLVGLCLSLIAAQNSKPERVVQGNIMASERDPKVRIELPESVEYVGAVRWVLYDIADCELHAFVEADGQKNVQRLYWVQFEGYLPTRPELKHTYDSPRHAQLGGKDFFVDTWVRTKDEETRPGSDREHVQALLHARGYNLPSGMMYLRLVHLLDATRRKELMIIYGEDLAATGFTVTDLKPEGKAYDRWPAIENGLIERAEQKIRIEFAGP